MNFHLITGNMGFFARSALLSVAIFAASTACSILLSVVFGSLATVRAGLVRVPIRIGIEFFRDVPLIVNLFFVFFGAPFFGLQLGAVEATIVSLSLWGGANGAEIVRGAINSVPKHQFESARALGSSNFSIFVFIVMPQALRPVIPAYMALCNILLHSTSLGALVGATELLKSAQIVITRSAFFDGGMPGLTIYSFILVIYFLAGSAMNRGTKKLEEKFGASARRA